MAYQQSKKRNLSPSYLDITSPVRKKAKTRFSPLSQGNSIICRPAKGKVMKRLTIKKLLDIPKVPDNFLEGTWEKLSTAVRAVHEFRPISDSKESLYGYVKDLCTHKLSSSCFELLQSQCKAHAQEIALQLDTSQSSDHSAFLTTIEHQWKNYTTQLQIIRNIFLYLDRTYVYRTSIIKSIWDMGITLFRSETLRDTLIVNNTIQGMLVEVQKERNGEVIPKSLLQSLARMFLAIDLYTNTFESIFLEQSKSFYHQEGLQRIATESTPLYLSYVQRRLREESDRVRSYLNHTSLQPLLEILHHELVLEHANTILEKGFDSMMKENAVADLKITFTLFRTIDKLDLLKSHFNAFVKRQGSDIVMHPERDANMVEELLAFKKKLIHIIKISFDHSDEFSHSLKEAFEDFINKRQNKPAELIAKFIDMKMRRGQKQHTESELEEIIDEVIDIFRSVQGKDVFQGHYRNHLSMRLLMEKCGSMDLEKLLISKLKEECGSSFTQKLESMFTDVNISRELMGDFRLLHPHVHMNVSVLSRGVWPEWPIVEARVSNQLVEQQELFSVFYASRYNGRKLTWQNGKSHCTLLGSFENGDKDITASLFQSLILLLFNDVSKLTVQEIRQRSGITDDGVLKLSIQSLAFNKNMRLLMKAKGPMTDSTVIGLNKAFSHKFRRLKVNQIQEKETEEEGENTNSSVFLERQYQIDAAIVRIMKTRKKLNHSVLLSELFSQLRFPVKPVDIKKRIESLIERDYLDRDAEDSQSYSYLA